MRTGGGKLHDAHPIGYKTLSVAVLQNDSCQSRCQVLWQAITTACMHCPAALMPSEQHDQVNQRLASMLTAPWGLHALRLHFGLHFG
jgi:hypothetical protein